jgi:hypothetical protein
MVTFLPQAQRGSNAARFAEQIGGSFRQGMEQGEEQRSKLEQLAMQEQMKALQKQQIQEQKFEQIANLLQSGQKQPSFGRLGAQNDQMAGQGMGAELAQGESSQEGFDATKLDDKLIAQITLVDRDFGNALSHAKDVGLREQTAKRTAEEKKTAAARKETLPLRKEYADKSKFAEQAIENKKTALGLLRTGKVQDPLVVGIASYLPGAIQGRILSNETQLYKAGLFEEFGVLKNMFPGQIRVKEIELLEDKLASLEKSHGAKESILETGIKKAQRDIILAKSARQVEKENPNASYLEFQQAVSEKAKPELDKLYEEIMTDYQNIYFKYAPAKSSYVDQNGRKYHNVPKSDLETLFQEAKESGLELKVI